MTRSGPTYRPAEADPGDYEYDLVHEDLAPEDRAPTGRVAPGPLPSPVRVSTGPGDAGGDYGYDLAHDLPRGV